MFIQPMSQVVGITAKVDLCAKEVHTYKDHTLLGSGFPRYVDCSKEDIQSIKSYDKYLEQIWEENRNSFLT